MGPNPDVAALVARMPDADKAGQTSTFTGPPPDEAAAVFDEILAGGREAILELIGLLRDTTDPDFRDFRAQYVLHGLALRVGRPGSEDARRLFAETLAGELASERLWRGVKAMLARELQVAGGKECAAALGALLLDGDLGDPAAAALLSIGGTAEEFRKALPRAEGRRRLAIIQALGVLRDAASLADLKDAAGEADREIRNAAVGALARIGDPSAADLLLTAAGAADPWERTRAVKACLLLAEGLAAAGRREEAKRIYVHLRDAAKDPKEAYVREAAERGLAKASAVQA